MSQVNEAGNREFFCVKEASAHSGLSLAELYRLARLGRIAHGHEGQQLRLRPRDLDDHRAQGQEDDR